MTTTKTQKPKLIKNKFARWGLLGFIGLFGVGSGIPYLAIFMVFLLFLPFAKVQPDEMFGLYVNRAGLRAFYVYLATTVAALLLVLVRACFGGGNHEAAILQSLVNEQMGQIAAVFGWIFIISVGVFAFTLMYYIYNEKKALGKRYFKGLQEFISENPIWGVIAVYFVAITVLQIGGVFVTLSFVPRSAMWGSFFALIFYIFLAAAVLLLANELFGFNQLGFRRQGLGQVLRWSLPLILVGCFIINWPLEKPLFSSLAETIPLLGDLIINLFSIIVSVIYSQIVYCSLILNILMERWGHNRSGIYRSLLLHAFVVTVPNMLFSLFVIGFSSLWLGLIISMFCLRLFFGALYIISDNLWAPIITHICGSVYTLIAGFLTVEAFTYTEMFTISNADPSAAIKQALCALLLLLISLFLTRGVKTRPQQKTEEGNVEPEVGAHA